MTIGIPIEIDTNNITTNVTDSTEQFNRYLRRNFPKNTKLRTGNDIYLNSGDDIIVELYNAQNTYTIGDVVYGTPNNETVNALFIYKEVKGDLPKAPQEYSLKAGETVPFDTSFNPALWTHRYLRILNSNFVGLNAIGIDDTSNTTKLTYYFADNMDGTCNATVAYSYGGIAYIIDSAYNIPLYSKLLGNELEEIASFKSAILIGGAKVNYFLPKYLIANSSGIYMRTTVASSVEYNTNSSANLFFPITSPVQLEGFYFLEKSNNMKPFDGKNYSVATAYQNMEYTLKSKSTNFNSIVLSGVLCSKVEIIVKNNAGTILEAFTRDIDGKRDTNGILDKYPTTEIFYATKVANFNSTDVVKITLIGSNTQLGTIMLTQAIDAGFTNLEISNAYKDYSVFEYDAFGNADYVERAKVSTYNAKVDIKINNYDMTDRLMQSLGKRVVVIDGCDNLSNGADIFSATQKIGRILTYSQNTKVKNNDIDKIASYSLSIEEIV